MIEATEPIRRAFVLVLTGTSGLVGALVVALAVRRGYRVAVRRRRAAILRRYQPLVDELLQRETASVASPGCCPPRAVIAR